MIRKPAVAGVFYPEKRKDLENFITEYYQAFERPEITCMGLVSPHAGYVYSGAVAAKTYAGISIPNRAIILSPNHTGLGTMAAVAPQSEWETPLGNVKTDLDLAKKLVEASKYMNFDLTAHIREHSAEVQLPFLQVKKPDIRIVPITMMYMSLDIVRNIGHTIAEVIKNTGESILIVASSDMNHYEPQSVTNRKDKIAIERIVKMDPVGLNAVIHEHNISMCGYIPAIAMLTAAMELGAKKAELVDYRTSGDVSGDYSSVVGYAGIIVK